MRVSKNIEWLVILFGLATLLMLYGRVSFAGPLLVAAVTILGVYYLLSGGLVIANSKIERIIRIIYSVGLWALAMGLLGLLYKFSFWKNSGIFLAVSVSFSLAVLIVMLVNYRTTPAESRGKVRGQYSALLPRLLAGTMIFLVLYFIPDRSLYKWFGTYRDDPVYIEKLMDVLENPADTVKAKILKEYEQQLNPAPDIPQSPGNR